MGMEDLEKKINEHLQQKDIFELGDKPKENVIISPLKIERTKVSVGVTEEIPENKSE
jgi:hypothetical protein